VFINTVSNISIVSMSFTQSHTTNLLSMIPNANHVIKVDIDSMIQNIDDQDRVIVSNVIKTMTVLRTYELVKNIEIVKTKKGYDIVGCLATNLDQEMIITAADFEILQSVNPCRVACVLVQISEKALELVVRVYSHDTPIVFNSVQISHISKKSRWI
jgi:hypothetical protein